MKTQPLVKHNNHNVIIKKLHSGPHHAKYHCIDCNKFVAWVSQLDFEKAKDLGLVNDLF